MGLSGRAGHLTPTWSAARSVAGGKAIRTIAGRPGERFWKGSFGKGSDPFRDACELALFGHGFGTKRSDLVTKWSGWDAVEGRRAPGQEDRAGFGKASDPFRDACELALFGRGFGTKRSDLVTKWSGWDAVEGRRAPGQEDRAGFVGSTCGATDTLPTRF